VVAEAVEDVVVAVVVAVVEAVVATKHLLRRYLFLNDYGILKIVIIRPIK
jgi:hypothetical protein